MVSKCIIFKVKSFLGNFYRHLAIFFWSHWSEQWSLPFYNPLQRSYLIDIFTMSNTGKATDQDMLAPDLLPNPPQTSQAGRFKPHLVTSCCSCKTAWWRLACCWLGWRPMSIGDTSKSHLCGSGALKKLIAIKISRLLVGPANLIHWLPLTHL